MATTSASRTWMRVAAARLDGRLLLGVALVAASMAGGLLFWGAAREATPVLVAARDIPRGQVLRREDLDASAVRLEGALSELAIPEDNLRALLGRPVTSGIRQGEMVIWPDVASGPGIGLDEVAVTVPVTADTVYPGLQAGDPVRVLGTRAKGKPESQTVTLLARARIYHVALDRNRITVGRTTSEAPQEEQRDIASITLLVPEGEAERLTNAVVNWDITLALLAPLADGKEASPAGVVPGIPAPSGVAPSSEATATSNVAVSPTVSATPVVTVIPTRQADGSP